MYRYIVLYLLSRALCLQFNIVLVILDDPDPVLVLNADVPQVRI